MRLPKPISGFRATSSTLALALALIGVYLVSFAPPAPEIPEPQNFDKLEPQLRDYLTEKLRWVREAPKRADRHATLGLIYAVNGLWVEARHSFSNAAALNPKEPLPWMYGGVAAQELGDLPAATATYRDLTARFPSFAPGFYRLGSALLRAGQAEEAENAYQRLTALAPGEWRGFAGLGEIKARQGHHAQAAELLEKAVQLDESAQNARHLLGQMYLKLGRKEDAERELRLSRDAFESPVPDEWSKIAWQHIRVLQDQARLASDCLESGEPEKAVEILARASAYHPEDVGLMNQLAIALNRSEQPQKACAVAMQALQKDRNYVPAIITLSLCQQKLGESMPALATAERAITLAPNTSQAYIAKANALLASERDAEAVTALEAAARLDPQNPELPMEIGDVLWRNLKRPHEARDRYEAARRLNPVLVPVHLRLADLYLHLRNVDAAASVIANLRKIAPKIPELDVLERRLRKFVPP